MFVSWICVLLLAVGPFISCYYAGRPPIPLKKQLCPGLLYAPPCHPERGMSVRAGASAEQQAALGEDVCYFSNLRF